MYQLGSLPYYNVSVAARQCLMGGYYELVNKTTFQPNPDYWGAYVYTKLIGQRAYTTTVTQQDSVYVFAYDLKEAPDRHVLMLLNNDKSASSTVDISFSNAVMAYTYTMTGDVTSDQVTLNGVELTLKNSSPPIVPVVSQGR